MKLKIGFLSIFFITPLAQADSEWFSFTLDNDIFVGNDSGYSNGFYFSWISPFTGQHKREMPILVKPLTWSLNNSEQVATVISNTIGQAINTPSDINIENPDANDLPYSGLLFLIRHFSL